VPGQRKEESQAIWRNSRSELLSFSVLNGMSFVMSINYLVNGPQDCVMF
jgi:hypothetical protein